MRQFLAIAIAAGVIGAAPPAGAIGANVPPSGLPSASSYSAVVLPELDGVVSWKTLAEVEPIKREGKMAPEFSRKILELDGQRVRMQGFVLPMDLGARQQHFLISAVPPHCPFCLPAGPDAVVEVLAKSPINYSLEPILVSGKLAVLKNDPSGLLYRLTEAEPIDAHFK